MEILLRKNKRVTGSIDHHRKNAADSSSQSILGHPADLPMAFSFCKKTRIFINSFETGTIYHPN
jgi:hypothetical protein